MWLEGAPELSAKRIEADTLEYFRGIAVERGKNYEFAPDVAKVTTYREDAGEARTLGGKTAQAFSGRMSIYDTHGKVIELNSEVVTTVCRGSNRTSAFFAQSIDPRSGKFWKELDAVRDSYRCGR